MNDLLTKIKNHEPITSEDAKRCLKDLEICNEGKNYKKEFYNKWYPCDTETCKECIWYFENKQGVSNCKLWDFTGIDKNIKNCRED